MTLSQLGFQETLRIRTKSVYGGEWVVAEHSILHC